MKKCINVNQLKELNNNESSKLRYLWKMEIGDTMICPKQLNSNYYCIYNKRRRNVDELIA